MRAVAAIVAGLLAVALLVGCGESRLDPRAPAPDPDIRGVVTAVEPSGEAVTSIRVVWTDAPSVGAKSSYDAAQVAVVASTDIRRRTGGVDEPASSEFKIGDVVEVWFTGPVRESYPVQATAATVVITGVYEGDLPVPPGLEP